MSILGIDYGEKKIGLAKSAGKLAVPLMILENKGDNFVFRKIQEICESEDIDAIVVGVPLSLSGGKESRQYKKVIDFIGKLSPLNKKIISEDERFTTKMAQEMKGGDGNKNDDALSAMLILQSYLDKITHSKK